MKAPDDYDPVRASYIERENAQINPLFALLLEVSTNRLETMRADRRADEQSQQRPPTP